MSLNLENLARRIGQKWIIQNLNLNVDPGECLALLGPSGCGKSSTLRLIAGLDKPTRGSIYLLGKDITNISPLKRRVGMVFQSYALYPHLDVYNNLALGLKIRGISIKDQKHRLDNVLGLLKLDLLSNYMPSQLSGGQRQRVALARALLRDPDLYLLDEPMSNLDAQLREDLRPELRNLILGNKQPVVYVTHDQQEAMAMANRIALLKEGRLEQIGTPKELYLRPRTTFVAGFIGRPQINFIKREPGIIVGIRPEDVKFSIDGLPSKIIHKEWHGSNQLLLLDSKFGKIRMITKANMDIPSDINLTWSKSKEHLFREDSKEAIIKD